MALSNHEQRVFDEISSACQTEDPGFALRVNIQTAFFHRIRGTMLGALAMSFGGAMFLLGISIVQGLISAGTIVAFYGIVILTTGEIHPRMQR